MAWSRAKVRTTTLIFLFNNVIGEIWKKHRRLLTPAFHFEILQQFVEVFEKCGDIFVEKFQNEIGHSFDIYPYITFCTLDKTYGEIFRYFGSVRGSLSSESIMGVNLNVQKGETAEYVQSVHDMTRVMTERSVNYCGSQKYGFLVFCEFL
jgi:cytochrome P450 family 4